MIVDRPEIPLIAIYTDFGPTGPYLGQMAAVIAVLAPKLPQVTLMADAPMFDPQSAGLLLAHLCNDLPAQTLVLAVVDPGVGGERRPIMMNNGTHLFVGPDNGLFVPVVRRSEHCEIEAITWRPQRLSDSFHGRDLFAPVAAKLAIGEAVSGTPLSPRELVEYDLAFDNNRVIYIDNYGNALTGIDGRDISDDKVISVNGATLRYARTFSEVPVGQPFWYRNSNNLLEIAVNRGNASQLLNLEPRMRVLFQTSVP
ncbi:MAG: SAM-dependent chlorinase/fluorinase [Candidatus Thiodiazotropha sp.]